MREIDVPFFIIFLLLLFLAAGCEPHELRADSVGSPSVPPLEEQASGFQMALAKSGAGP